MKLLIRDRKKKQEKERTKDRNRITLLTSDGAG